MKRIFLWIKKSLGFRMTYGELAEIVGDGPCRRCVGRSVNQASALIFSLDDKT
jgi:alkylated DNA nucleotide flippase Atl1